MESIKNMQSTSAQRDTLHRSGISPTEVAPGITQVQTLLVNLFLVAGEEPDRWVLVDAGIPWGTSRVLREAQRRFGDVPPQCVVLTHGHFDHVGGLNRLLTHWDVPVYAHELELPYLDGRADYPPPDPTVGGGMMARSAPLYPRHAYDFRPNIRALPGDGSVPGLPGWRWVHTPGHTPGHVSLFRESDAALIAGDAFTTQKQESMLGVLTQHRTIHGPPMYFTTDWEAARDSAERLRGMNPRFAATGHGLPLRDVDVARALDHLCYHWDRVARPRKGRYVSTPALADSSGPTRIPPRRFDPFPLVMAGVTLAAAGAVYGARRYMNCRLERDWLDD